MSKNSTPGLYQGPSDNCLPRAVLPSIDDSLLETLSQQGFLVIPNFFPAPFCHGIKQVAQYVPLSKAFVGRGSSHQQVSSIRQDATLWLDEHLLNVNTLPTLQQQLIGDWLCWSDALRLQLNAFFRLPLKRFESHLACYSAGGGYAKHLDVFSGSNTRVLSTVLYLNEAWQAQWGGQLHIEKPMAGPFSKEHTMPICSNESNSDVVVEPTLGTLVLFFSEWFPHQVLPAYQARFSIAGWYRVDA